MDGLGGDDGAGWRCMHGSAIPVTKLFIKRKSNKYLNDEKTFY